LFGILPQMANTHTRTFNAWIQGPHPQFGISLEYANGMKFSIADLFFGQFSTMVTFLVVGIGLYFVFRLIRKITSIVRELCYIRSILKSAKKLGQSRVYQAKSYKGSPFVCGLFRQIILVPADFYLRYNSSERKAILAHEKSHLEHMDLVINWTLMVSDLFFAHIPMKWAQERISFYQECACDEKAVRRGVDRIVLSSTLLKSAKSQFDYAPALEGKHTLKHRILAIAKIKKRGAWIYLLMVCAAYFGIGVFMAKLWTI
nr:M56 family metallopeptidase [bacterium]